MQINKPGFANCFSKDNFVNAFDEYNERNRKLFDIPNIDDRLNFEDKRNICIVNKSSSSISHSYLYSFITNACIAYHFNSDDVTYDYNISPKKKMTLLVDADNGNNLGYIYLDLVKKSSIKEFDIKEILKQITVVRAFTFFQLTNIIINEIPKYILQLGDDYKIQIIVIDFLATLLEPFHGVRTKDHKRRLRSEWDFKNNIKLVNDIIETLFRISTHYFVILSFDNGSNVVNNYSLFYEFSNLVEIDLLSYSDTSNNKNRKNMREAEISRKEILVKIKSKKIPSNSTITHSVFYDYNNMSSLASIDKFSSILSTINQNLINSWVI